MCGSGMRHSACKHGRQEKVLDHAVISLSGSLGLVLSVKLLHKHKLLLPQHHHPPQHMRFSPAPLSSNLLEHRRSSHHRTLFQHRSLLALPSPPLTKHKETSLFTFLSFSLSLSPHLSPFEASTRQPSRASYRHRCPSHSHQSTTSTGALSLPLIPHKHMRSSQCHQPPQAIASPHLTARQPPSRVSLAPQGRMSLCTVSCWPH